MSVSPCPGGEVHRGQGAESAAPHPLRLRELWSQGHPQATWGGVAEPGPALPDPKRPPSLGSLSNSNCLPHSPSSKGPNHSGPVLRLWRSECLVGSAAPTSTPAGALSARAPACVSQVGGRGPRHRAGHGPPSAGQHRWAPLQVSPHFPEFSILEVSQRLSLLSLNLTLL